MLDSEIAALADLINAANPFLADRERDLAHVTYRLLAEGRPLPIERLVSEAKEDFRWVEQTLDGWTGVFWDEEGRIIGFWGLALPETGHRFDLNGRTLYTWCAWDPLFIAPLLSETALITSICPVTGRTVTLDVGPGGVSDLDPPEAALSFLRPTPEMKEDVVASFCHYVLLFASKEAADEWVGNSPGTFVISVEDGFELGRRTLGRFGGTRPDNS